MKRHRVVAAAPRVAEPLHVAHAHHAPPAAHVVAGHHGRLAILFRVAGLAGAVRVDEAVEPQKLRGQLIGIDRRDDGIDLALHDDRGHARMRLDVGGAVDERDRILARAAAHYVHPRDARMRFAERRARMQRNGGEPLRIRRQIPQHDQATRRELEKMVQGALAQVSPELREAVILRDLQDMDYKEIAQVLSIPEGTVKSRISRGRAELARLLERNKREVM